MDRLILEEKLESLRRGSVVWRKNGRGRQIGRGVAAGRGQARYRRLESDARGTALR